MRWEHMKVARMVIPSVLHLDNARESHLEYEKVSSKEDTKAIAVERNLVLE